MAYMARTVKGENENIFGSPFRGAEERLRG